MLKIVLLSNDYKEGGDGDDNEAAIIWIESSHVRHLIQASIPNWIGLCITQLLLDYTTRYCKRDV